MAYSVGFWFSRVRWILMVWMMLVIVTFVQILCG